MHAGEADKGKRGRKKLAKRAAKDITMPVWLLAADTLSNQVLNICRKRSVTWMERSAIRGLTGNLWNIPPDYAALPPGYKSGCRRKSLFRVLRQIG